MPDIALVSLGTTPGLRTADEAFVQMARESGLFCDLVPVDIGGSGKMRRQSTMTDYVEARAAKVATSGLKARVIVYSTVTAALMQKPAGDYAVRFDSPAALNRPGVSGSWQRRREVKMLTSAKVLLPWGDAAARSIPQEAHGIPAVPLRVPIAIDADAARSASIAGTGERDIDALAYAGYPEKRGLDILVQAWQIASGGTRRLRVVGIDRNRALEYLKKQKIPEPPNVEWVGLMEPGQFRYTLSRTKMFINASRREDHGLSQLEALGAGAALVTVPSEGPYEALPLAVKLNPRLVAPTNSPQALAFAIREGFNVDLADYGARAHELLTPYTFDSIKQVFATQVVPALGLR